MKKRIIFSLIISVCFYSLSAQLDTESELFLTFKKLDSTFFERGFNNCDFDYLEKTTHKDLVFYHDKGGVANKASFLDATRKYICPDSDRKPIRKVEVESLEVFPLYNDNVLYGAIQRGIHNFYIREPNKEDVHTSRAKFTHLYLLENGNWLLKEVLSFDHKEPEEIIKELSFDEELEALLIKEKMPALGLGIIRDGELKQVQVFGNLKEGVSAPYNSIFKVASITKPIVAIITMKLIDSGTLELDEQLSNYWIDPDLMDDKRYELLTPKIILSHQTGLPNWRYLNEQNKLEFDFDPGAKYQYSGEGFEYLRQSLENKIGKTIEQLADSLVFGPAKMNDTRFWWDDSMDPNRYAENHDNEGNQLETNKYYEANAAANLLTTVEDYSNFMVYVLNGAGISQQLFDEMTANQIKIKENEFFGLGWQKLTGFSTGEYALMHTGGDPGVRTLAIFFSESKNGYVVFANGENVDNIYEFLMSKHLYLGNELWDKR